MDKPVLVVIAGPTASGKTGCAVALAEKKNGEVVSADSMQIYRGMEVLSAKPDAGEMRGIAHHLLGVAEPAEKYSAARYGEEARRVIAQIAARGRLPILCGGTGLYIDAVTRPMRFCEECDEKLRRELMAIADEKGGKRRLHAMLAEVDPEAAAKFHENDVRRVSRAIEVYRLTGRTQSEQKKLDAAREGDYHETLFALRWPREELYRRIDLRVDEMLKRGLVDEVRALKDADAEQPTAMQAIGYKEIVLALDGRISMADAVELVKQASRNYAKRQMTWFTRDRRTVWLDAMGKTPAALAEEIINYLEENKCLI